MGLSGVFLCLPHVWSEELPAQEQRATVPERSAPYLHAEGGGNTHRENRAGPSWQHPWRSCARIPAGTGSTWEPPADDSTGALRPKQSAKEKSYTERRVIHISLKASSLKY